MGSVKVYIFALVFILRGCEQAQKIDVDVYYESLCPDSLRFVNQQLRPIWNDFSKYINLNLVPFGKSYNINNGQDFECQHGPKECIGNKIQSCAISAIHEPDDQVNFVHCFMNVFYNDDYGQDCAAKIGLNWNYVSNCFQSEMGTNLQLQAEVATNNIAPRFVPTVVFNKVFNQDEQDRAQTDFKGVLCKYLENVKECQ